MSTMRAKLRVVGIQVFETMERKVTQMRVTMNAVGPSTAYPEDGTDENNTYAKWTPSAIFEASIMNPALFDSFKINAEFYVDFTAAS